MDEIPGKIDSDRAEDLLDAWCVYGGGGCWWGVGKITSITASLRAVEIKCTERWVATETWEYIPSFYVQAYATLAQAVVALFLSEKANRESPRSLHEIVEHTKACWPSAGEILDVGVRELSALCS